MAAGCDFICDNKECQQYRSGVVLTGPWPLGDIDLVMSNANVEKIKEFCDGLKQLKDTGRQYACITYPNINKVPTIGYRVQRWCTKCSFIWLYDLMLTEAENTYETIREKSDIPISCSKCNSPLQDYDQVLKSGIICPFCKVEMKQSRWYSNETEN